MEELFFLSLTSASKFIGAGLATIGVVVQVQVLELYSQVY